MAEKVNFHSLRCQYQPQLPQLLRLEDLKTVPHEVQVKPAIAEIFPHLCKNLRAVTFEPTQVNENTIRAPLRIGCVLSGGQAAGGHNVIVGLYDQIKRRHPNSQLFGFLKGPEGIYKGKYEELKEEKIQYFRNRGGFDMIQSGRHKIETEEQFNKSLQYCESLKLDGLVVIGGDDSNTNACLLAEYFLKHGCATSVIGCPKTIDGDLKNEFVEVSFGFDTACKTYSELIGNIMLDTVSSKKYYHFIRLMGRSASHIALECALLTRPNLVLIGEEVEEKKISLKEIVQNMADIISERQKNGMNHGVFLVPEGLIEFIGEVKSLINEINVILGKTLHGQQFELDELYVKVKELLTPVSAELLDFLPRDISEQLLLDRDPHGNVQVAKIETEKLLIQLLEVELKRRAYPGKFLTINHYYGYEGRCAFPTNFDCDYCYSLGVNSAILIENKYTGLMSCVRNLDKKPIDWQASGYPLVTMMDVETRKGKQVPVIKKALVELNGKLFKYYEQHRKLWAFEDHYIPTGPIQFELPMLNPFLINGEGFDFLDAGEEFQGDKPYEVVLRRNLSGLGAARAQEPLQIPPNLNLGLGLKQIHHDYSDQVTKSIENHYQDLLKTSSEAFQLLDQHLPSKPLKIGITLNGRQSPGANSIIRGLLEAVKQSNSVLYGFIGGTQGLFQNNYIKVDDSNLKYYINQGGYHFLGRTADKMRSEKELQLLQKTVSGLDLDGLVVVGASHTLTDCVIVANYFLKQNLKTRVIAVPCTVDNNIGHPLLEGIVGFDSAAKTYSQLIGNIMIDAASAVKYWYFIRLMGRDPSHLVLECALQTHPNVVLISEDIKERGLTLQDVVNEIADVIVLRWKQGKEFGTVLVPEGLLAHIGQFKQLINELDKYFKLPQGELEKNLTPWSLALFKSLPDFAQKQLTIEREVHGSIQLSQIETERLLAHLVSQELKNRKQQGYKGSFAPICHFFGYQGRCAFPTLFDVKLGEVYGYLSGLLIQRGLTGYSVSARGIAGPIEKWHFIAIPLLGMLSLKQKSQYGENEPVISSYEVDLKKNPFKVLQKVSKEWYQNDLYENPGPIQFKGAFSNSSTLTLQLSYKNYVEQIEEIDKLTKTIHELLNFETREELLDLAIQQLKVLQQAIHVVQVSKL
ncbi:hypothetical protein pb186bvf_018574 [Paramecium bursaria]